MAPNRAKGARGGCNIVPDRIENDVRCMPAPTRPAQTDLLSSVVAGASPLMARKNHPKRGDCPSKSPENKS